MDESEMIAGLRTISEVEEICGLLFQIVRKKTFADKSVAAEVNTALQNIAKMTARYLPVQHDAPNKAKEYMKGVMAVELPVVGFPAPRKAMTDPLTGAKLKRCCCCDMLKPVKDFEPGKDNCMGCAKRVWRIQHERAKANKKAPADEAEAF